MPPTLADYETIVSKLVVNRSTQAMPPQVSIVIPTFNAAHGLGRTLDSVAAQNRADLEVIVADGGSTDGTLEIIRSVPELVTTWVSAADTGISDAFNRGIALSRGEFVQIINADDCLGELQINHAIGSLRSHPNAGFVYGDVVMRDAAGHTTRSVRGIPNLHDEPFDSMARVPHPSICVRMSTYATVGLFETGLRLTMDFDWLARCFRAGIDGVYSADICAEMAEGGASNRAAMTRDLENYQITRRYETMPLALAFGRMALRMGMNTTRACFDILGRPNWSYAFRRWVDHGLGRS